ncbi:MAG: hypothetical protein ACYDCJ_12505 [Gammaproteobacteria bacterium]
MRVFVANGTHQHMHFNYRLPEKNSFRSLEIRAGRQARFSEDLSDTDLASLISQLERYGAVGVADVKHITIPRTLLYSVDRKISSDKIDEARVKDEAARQEVAAQKLEEAGLAQFPTDHLAGATKSTSLEVVQLGDQGQEGIKGGVDTQVVVSKTAGRKAVGKRKGG